LREKAALCLNAGMIPELKRAQITEALQTNHERQRRSQNLRRKQIGRQQDSKTSEDRSCRTATGFSGSAGARQIERITKLLVVFLLCG
jgi:hypothetical protein